MEVMKVKNMIGKIEKCHDCGKEIKSLEDGVKLDGTLYCSYCWDNEEVLVAPED